MSLTAIVFGAGKNIGRATALRLKSEGYKVAVASRSANAEQAKADGFFPVTVDLAKPSSVAGAFDSVVKELGIPSVILYNAAGAFFNPPTDPFATSLADFESCNAINISSFYSVVQEFIKHGRTLPAGTQKTVLYTGNALNTVAMPIFVTLGAGKCAAAHIVAVGAASPLVEEGFRFYYVDERKADGTPANMDISGPAHAEVFSQLIKQKKQGEPNVLFVSPGKITHF